jgi:hypothetical protein
VQFRNVSFAERYEPIPGERQVFEQVRNMLLVARQAIEGLSDHNLELAGPGILQQCLIGSPQT